MWKWAFRTRIFFFFFSAFSQVLSLPPLIQARCNALIRVPEGSESPCSTVLQGRLDLAGADAPLH